MHGCSDVKKSSTRILKVVHAQARLAKAHVISVRIEEMMKYAV